MKAYIDIYNQIHSSSGTDTNKLVTDNVSVRKIRVEDGTKSEVLSAISDALDYTHDSISIVVK